MLSGVATLSSPFREISRHGAEADSRVFIVARLCSRRPPSLSTMTGAWQYPVHSHPWFRMPSHKRKAFEREDSSSSDYSDLERYAHPSKRLRCGILENGFAQLSLDAVNQFPVVTEPPSSYTPPDVTFSDEFSAAQQNTSNAASFTSGSIAWDGTTYDASQADLQHSQPVVLPGSVEEPTSPEAPTTPEPPDITMKSRSWYEPEKDRECFRMDRQIAWPRSHSSQVSWSSIWTTLTSKTHRKTSHSSP